MISSVVSPFRLFFRVSIETPVVVVAVVVVVVV